MEDYEPAQIISGPDPGGPKMYGSVVSESGTLLLYGTVSFSESRWNNHEFWPGVIPGSDPSQLQGWLADISIFLVTLQWKESPFAMRDHSGVSGLCGDCKYIFFLDKIADHNTISILESSQNIEAVQWYGLFAGREKYNICASLHAYNSQYFRIGLRT